MDARTLLSDAEAIFDQSDELPLRASLAWRGGFDSGAAWMRHALELLRDRPLPSGGRAYQWFGFAKYGLATSASSLFVLVMIRTGWPLLALGGVIVFYGIEAQLVFLFPLLLDNSPTPLGDSLRWTRRAGGTLTVMRTVMRLAITMLFGGMLGAGFVRSWSLGCLAVCIWYERVRTTPSSSKPGSRFTIGASSELLVRRERIDGGRLPRPLRVLYVSDLHLGRRWNRGVVGHIVRAARAANAHVILLGGDLLDCAAVAPCLRRCVRLLCRLAPVYCVAGNHDHRCGIDLVRETVVHAGATWLTNATPLRGWNVVLIPGVLAQDIDAVPIGDRVILCAHDPSIFPAAVRAAVDLVLAGHLHGGQCVLFQRGLRLYPGAWFARWTGLRFCQGRSTLLVSRGAADTLPVRWNCPREVILCEIS